MDMFFKCWKHCVDFSGRASREEFLHFWMVNVIVTAVLSVVAYLLLYNFVMFSHISFCYSLAALLPGVAVCVRRLHDVGRTGLMFLLIFVPVLGFIYLAILMLLKGSNDENQWGSPAGVEILNQ